MRRISVNEPIIFYCMQINDVFVEYNCFHLSQSPDGILKIFGDKELSMMKEREVNLDTFFKVFKEREYLRVMNFFSLRLFIKGVHFDKFEKLGWVQDAKCSFRKLNNPDDSIFYFQNVKDSNFSLITFQLKNPITIFNIEEFMNSINLN